jgi:hypothetical protein
MSQPSHSPRKEQRLLQNARREALVIMIVWALALVWSCLVSYFFGYSRPPTDIGLILGMPDWVFWGIFLPWALCLAFSVWFCFRFMADDDLGADPPENQVDA